MNAYECMRILGISRTVQEQLLEDKNCECGALGVALGLFDSCMPSGAILHQAMWLCEECIKRVDATVYIIRIDGRALARGDHNAMFYAIFRAELKELITKKGPPSEWRWNRRRARNLPDAGTVQRRLGKSWSELCSEVWEQEVES